MTGSAESVVWCRCEDTTDQEVCEVVEFFGAATAEEVKRYTRCGMGPCQGRICLPPVREFLHNERGIPLPDPALGRLPRPARPPVHPVLFASMTGWDSVDPFPAERIADVLPQPLDPADSNREMVNILLDGEPVALPAGRPLGAALWAAGVLTLRTSLAASEPRGLFCARGWCRGCLVTIDGRPNQLACMEPLRKGMRVVTQKGTGRWGEEHDAGT